jgi:hypothetical protein
VEVTVKIKEIVSIALPFLLSLFCHRFGKAQISEESGNDMCDVKKKQPFGNLPLFRTYNLTKAEPL